MVAFLRRRRQIPLYNRDGETGRSELETVMKDSAVVADEYVEKLLPEAPVQHPRTLLSIDALPNLTC